MAKAETGYVRNEISKNMNNPRTLENSQENCSN